MCYIDTGVFACEPIIVTGRFPRIDDAASETGGVVILAVHLGPALLSEGIALTGRSLDVVDLIVEIIVMLCILSSKY